MAGSPYSSITVAEEFTRLADTEGEELTPMQILKLVYIAHGWSLALLNRPLIKDQIYAWRYGPVIPRLYSRIKKYGWNTVPLKSFKSTEKLATEDKKLIKKTYEIYGYNDGMTLSRLTHQSGTPWEKTYWNGQEIIPNKIIKEYYIGLRDSG